MPAIASMNRISAYPPVATALTGDVTRSVDGLTPECPSCGGKLDPWPTSVDDHTELFGRCLDCDRHALVLDGADGSLERFAVPIPSRPEALAYALRVFRGE